MAWWLWCIFGLALLFTELVIPTNFFLFFFGMGAFVIALCVKLTLFPLASTQWFCFSVISIALFIFFRKKVASWSIFRERSEAVDSITGSMATVTEPMEVAAYGAVELYGTRWKAKNVGETILSEKDVVKVSRVDGLTLEVTAIVSDQEINTENQS
jgi:membrane protein implicated in regulation of membrane protease activity